MSEIFNLISNSEFDIFFLVVDPMLSLTLKQLSNLHILTAQKDVNNSGRFLSLQETQSQINKISQRTGHKVAIMPFKPSAKLEYICQKNDWLLISNPAKLNRFLEDKIIFTKEVGKLNIPTIPSIIAPFNSESVERAKSTFGKPLVVQTHFGWAGNSTHLLTDFDNLSQSIGQNTIVKFSPLLKGYSLLNNCVISKGRLIQSPPALQYTGVPELTQNPFSTVGRQWPSYAPTDVVDQVIQITKTYSEYLIKLSYTGFFGLDFFVSENQDVYLLECNPRLTASFNFYTQLELGQNLESLIGFHIADFLNLEYDSSIHKKAINPDNKLLTGSEIVKKDISGRTQSRYNDLFAFSQNPKDIKLPQEILKKL